MRFEAHPPEHHLRVVRALQAGPRAPESLRRRIAAMEAEAARRSRPMPALLTRPFAHVRPLAAGVAAVFAAALVAVLSLGGSPGPTGVQAAELAVLPATAPEPPLDAERPARLERSFDGVTFPAWSREFDWDSSGRRTDAIDGRDTETVFYTHTHHRIGYTVISGETIDPPRTAATLTVRGLVLHRFRVGDLDVVMFERNGRTCVLSGDVHDPFTLVKLASWRAVA